jgi:hypothetical protein
MSLAEKLIGMAAEDAKRHLTHLSRAETLLEALSEASAAGSAISRVLDHEATASYGSSESVEVRAPVYFGLRKELSDVTFQVSRRLEKSLR